MNLVYKQDVNNPIGLQKMQPCSTALTSQKSIELLGTQFFGSGTVSCHFHQIKLITSIGLSLV